VYQIQVSFKKNYKGVKTYAVKKTAQSYTVKKLKAKKKYYVRVRGYKTYKGGKGNTNKVYGEWNSVSKKRNSI